MIIAMLWLTARGCGGGRTREKGRGKGRDVTNNEDFAVTQDTLR